jgi:hypothetical protein
MAEKELASTEIGDIFSPLKHTMRDLDEEFQNLPSEDALADCARTTPLKDDLLKKAGLLRSACGVRELRVLIKDAGSIAVLEGDGGDLVAPGFEFLCDKPAASKQECLAAISRLLDMAWLSDASKLGFGRSISKANQRVFIKAVTARAMDAQVVTKLDSSTGLTNEWAGAAIYIANEDEQMQVPHVTTFLKNQGGWVFGDYVQGLSKRRLRLLMRQLHRVIASLLDRVLAPTEVRRFSRLARTAKKWAQNAEDFQKVIDDIVQLSKTPV